MKKMVCSLFLFYFLCLPAVSLFAKEDSPAALLRISPLKQASQREEFPFEFSVSPGKWEKAQRGKLFTTGYHPSDFTLPSLKEEPAPIRYPRWAVREGWEGTFVMAVEILTTGEVGRWGVIESTGYPLLDEAAVGAVRQWRFHPGTEHNNAVAMCIQIPIHFELTSST